MAEPLRGLWTLNDSGDLDGYFIGRRELFDCILTIVVMCTNRFNSDHPKLYRYRLLIQFGDLDNRNDLDDVFHKLKRKQERNSNRSIASVQTSLSKMNSASNRFIQNYLWCERWIMWSPQLHFYNLNEHLGLPLPIHRVREHSDLSPRILDTFKKSWEKKTQIYFKWSCRSRLKINETC